MTYKSLHIAAIAVLIAASGCSSPSSEGNETTADDTRDNLAHQRQQVERAIIAQYEREGVDVTEIAMERNEDGTEYVGQATVRNPESGNELVVDCSVWANASGEPQIECNRTQADE